jgi:hypothetical protein
MKVIVPPKSPENCINVAELTDNYLIICYVNNKPKGVICKTSYDDEYEFRINSQYDDYWDENIKNANCIAELINNILEAYPNATFEAYE